MTSNPGILTPVLVLIIWTQVMLVWLYATRLPAAMKHTTKDMVKMNKSDFDNLMPWSARWSAANYAHLTEHPTIFYALVFYLFLTNHATSLQVLLAWVYVAIRVVHSFVQSFGVQVLVRFQLFIASALVVALMTGLAVTSLLTQQVK